MTDSHSCREPGQAVSSGMSSGFRLRTLKSALLERSLTEGLSAEETRFRALSEGVSFAVEKGKAFGVIGSNGSGKSTLLKIGYRDAQTHYRARWRWSMVGWRP